MQSSESNISIGFCLLLGIFLNEIFTFQEKVDQYWPKMRWTAMNLFSETFYICEPMAIADERTIKYLGAPLATDEITIKRSFDGDALGGVMRFPVSCLYIFNYNFCRYLAVKRMVW
jgi:hypothetical protein